MTLERIMTDDEMKRTILSLMTIGTHKFVVPLRAPLSQQQQNALEALMLDDWIRLIDVSPCPNAHPALLFRVFRVMPVAVEWYAQQPPK